MRVGDCLKYLKRGWNRKEGRGNKDFKKGGCKQDQGVSALKRGRGWNLLTNFWGDCLKEGGGLGHLADLRGNLAKKRGGVFEGGVDVTTFKFLGRYFLPEWGTPPACHYV